VVASARALLKAKVPQQCTHHLEADGRVGATAEELRTLPVVASRAGALPEGLPPGHASATSPRVGLSRMPSRLFLELPNASFCSGRLGKVRA
jgi:hypothetical protein